MSRYPRSVRDAKLKCIPCNAPVVETTSNQFVCVGCGNEPIRAARGDRVTVKESGIEVTRTVRPDGTDGHVARFGLDSSCAVPVGVRLLQPTPTTPSFHIENATGEGEWTATEHGLVWRGFVLPERSIETHVRVPEDVDHRTVFGETPWIEAVDPVDPEVIDGKVAPSWRGSRPTSAPKRAMADGSSTEQPEPGGATPNGGTVIEAGVEQTGAVSMAQAPTDPNEVSQLPDTSATGPVSETGPTSYLLPPDSERDPTISVVLPTLNEEEGIGPCIEAVEAALNTLELYGEVVVSDSSTDRTPRIARSYGANVVTPDRKGYGAAYRHGFANARGDYLVMGDADTTYDFEELPTLFEAIEAGEADLVMGSRFAGDIKDGAMPWLHRKIGNPLLTRFLNTFYDADVTDAHSGFRVITREALDELNLQSDGMEFASEMVMAASECGVTIDEVPITYHPRVGEAKLESLTDGWRHVKFMLTNTPSHVFSLPAVAISVLGLVMMGLSVLDSRLFGLTLGTHAIIGGSLLTIIGYQIANLAVFSAVAETSIRRPKDPVTAFIKDRFTLEHGTSLGLGMFALGAVYVTAMVVRWVSSGYASLPFVHWNMVAFTFLVLGVQTVFSSFFLSQLRRRPNRDGSA